ncbi:ABC transporter ATP-binding protein arb1 [Marasmius crinis-equi]|uniref:ABC transporter ATP-binding protein arb1 n=1 Tax=Marasmius crinis-equi TaxID=585013 RepID=A0ABR3EQU2_9AGAR
MAPSISKQKQLAEKATEQAAKAEQEYSERTFDQSKYSYDSGGPGNNEHEKPNVAPERSAAGVLVSDPKPRDIKIDQYTLSFHGRLLIEGAEIALNYGQRYGLLGVNGSGKAQDPDDQFALDAAYEELEELDLSTFQSDDDEVADEGHERRMEDESSTGEIAIRQVALLLVITSHSQDFMDNVGTNIMDLTQKKKVYYSGNYTTYGRMRFIASAGTYANLVRQAKSRQKILGKTVAAGLIEAVETKKPQRFDFEDIHKLPPPVITFNEVASL